MRKKQALKVSDKTSSAELKTTQDDLAKMVAQCAEVASRTERFELIIPARSFDCVVGGRTQASGQRD